MGIRFSKSIKLGNLIKLNISKSGISATVGKKGASINLGSKGTYLNLSPTVAGIKGTGVSYRQKITGGYGSLINKVVDKVQNKNDEKAPIENNIQEKDTDVSIIDKYKQDLEANINIHKYADNVLSKEELEKRINDFDNESSKEIYLQVLNGDEEIIESLVGAFLDNLDLNYEVKANYELEDHTLYVDLDLPEIENFKDEEPVLNKNEIAYKKKSQVELKEEYAKTIISLAIYLASNFFNITSYIDEIIMSGFTTRRNNVGDLEDDYLYSVKFLRETFEKTDLSKIDKAYDYLLNFENRINMSTTYQFKSIKPYEMEVTKKANSLIDDAIAGLKELGYKMQDINEILPKLKELNLSSSGDYLKEGLKLLKK